MLAPHAIKICKEIPLNFSSEEIQAMKYSYARELNTLVENGREEHAPHIPQYGLTLYSQEYLRRCITELEKKAKNNSSLSEVDFYALNLALLHLHACITYQNAEYAFSGLRAKMGLPIFNRQKSLEASTINGVISNLFSFNDTNDWMKIKLSPQPIAELPGQTLGEVISSEELNSLYRSLYSKELFEHEENIGILNKEHEMWTALIKAQKLGDELRHFNSNICSGIVILRDGICIDRATLVYFSRRSP